MLLKRRGEASVQELAADLGVTRSAIRQHLGGLVEASLVERRAVPSGPGRPPMAFSLASAGEALFPRTYGQLTNELLAYVEDEDPDLLEQIFERRRRRRVEQAKERLRSKRSFAARVSELTAILDADGYLADVSRRSDGSFLVTEHNCAILGVAERYGLACSTEIEFLRDALPEATVERVAHKLGGAHVCSYEIRRRRAAGASRRRVRAG
jgi:DeoR family transcriptional regulator, suf operon transcriptional repressor